MEGGNTPGAGVRYYEPDRLSTRVITNGSGAVVGTLDQLPFGEEVGTAGESEKHKFTSYERDSETGTDYAVNRQYQNALGRFMRPDPYGGSMSITDPQSFNRYTYVGNDPVNASDPSGLSEMLMRQAAPGIGNEIEFHSGGGGFDESEFRGGGGGGSLSGLYAVFGDRIADLPGFGTNFGSFADLGLAQHEERVGNAFNGNGFRTNDEIARETQNPEPQAPTSQAPTSQDTLTKLDKAGLLEHIDPDTITVKDNGSVTFRFDPQDEKEISRILNNTKVFLSGNLGGLHNDDVGIPNRDHRSIPGVLGPGILQVVVGTGRKDFLPGYADANDRFNPYQNPPFGILGHGLLEVFPHALGKIFGGK